MASSDRDGVLDYIHAKKPLFSYEGARNFAFKWVEFYRRSNFSHPL